MILDYLAQCCILYLPVVHNLDIPSFSLRLLDGSADPSNPIILLLPTFITNPSREHILVED